MKHQKLKTTPEVSKRMKALSHKKSKVESVLAKALWHKGYHYRLNYKKLPGTPDIALTKYRIAIFVDGEFCHGKDFKKTKEKLKNNKDYWIQKIEENMNHVADLFASERDNKRLEKFCKQYCDLEQSYHEVGGNE